MTVQPLPDVTDDTRAFWEGGSDGRLYIHRCAACSTWFHPPAPVCPKCLSFDVGPQPTSGRARLRSFSVNEQQWSPDMTVPYVVAVVQLVDAPGVQLMTRLVDVVAEDVRIDMALEVTFEPIGDDIHLPLFRPTGPVSNA